MSAPLFLVTEIGHAHSGLWMVQADVNETGEHFTAMFSGDCAGARAHAYADWMNQLADLRTRVDTLRDEVRELRNQLIDVAPVRRTNR